MYTSRDCLFFLPNPSSPLGLWGHRKPQNFYLRRSSIVWVMAVVCVCSNRFSGSPLMIKFHTWASRPMKNKKTHGEWLRATIVTGYPPTSVRGRRLTYENHGLGTDLGHSKTAEPVCYKPKTSRIYPLWPVPCNFSGSSATFRHSSPHRGSTGSPGRAHVHVPLDGVFVQRLSLHGDRVCVEAGGRSSAGSGGLATDATSLCARASPRGHLTTTLGVIPVRRSITLGVHDTKFNWVK